jgi:hypothetical protein
VSKLPGNIAAEKKKVAQAQQTIDVHMMEYKLLEYVIPYSHQLFRKAAIQWLIDVRGHPSVSLPPLSSPTLPLFICIPPLHLYTISRDHI